LGQGHQRPSKLFLMESIFDKLKKLRKLEEEYDSDIDEVVCGVREYDSDDELEEGGSMEDGNEGSIRRGRTLSVDEINQKLVKLRDNDDDDYDDEIVGVPMGYYLDTDGEEEEEGVEEEEKKEKDESASKDESTSKDDPASPLDVLPPNDEEKEKERKERKERKRLKKEAKKKEKEASKKRKKMEEEEDKDEEGAADSDDDDDETLKALQRWEAEKASKEDEMAKAASTKQAMSVYVSQISYDATESDVRDLFTSSSINVTSVRLVYNKNDGNSFRGVAFVDVKDEEDFGKALGMSGKPLKGRNIKVMPTKSTAELAVIVKEREKRLGDIKREGRELRDEIEGKKGGEKKVSDKLVNEREEGRYLETKYACVTHER